MFSESVAFADGELLGSSRMLVLGGGDCFGIKGGRTSGERERGGAVDRGEGEGGSKLSWMPVGGGYPGGIVRGGGLSWRKPLWELTACEVMAEQLLKSGSVKMLAGYLSSRDMNSIYMSHPGPRSRG